MGDTSARITVHVKPRSSRESVEGWKDGCLVVRLNAPPVEGAANEALVRLLAESLGVPRGRVRILTGLRSRRKLVEIEGIPAEKIREVLG